MLGPLVTEFARNLRARRPHLFSAASIPAFSVASRPSNSPDITRTPTSQRRPSARWSPVERNIFKVAPANSTWRVTGSSCRIAPVRRADVTADEGPAAASAPPRRRGERMSQREFVTLLGVALTYPPAADRRSGEFLIKGGEMGARLWLPNSELKAEGTELDTGTARPVAPKEPPSSANQPGPLDFLPRV